MRTIRALPDQFLGALLGAWLGLQTEIWKQPVEKAALFVASLVIIAILTSIVSGEWQLGMRWVAAVLLVAFSLVTGMAFLHLSELKIFNNGQEVVLFYVIILGWVSIGLIDARIAHFLSEWSFQKRDGGNDIGVGIEN